MGTPGQPMSNLEQIERDIIDYGGNSTPSGNPLNKYIFARAKRELAELKSDNIDVVEKEVKKEVKKSKLTFDEYKDKNMKELKLIAKKLKIPKYYDLKERKLINEIMKIH